jgi:hypothetical protein
VVILDRPYVSKLLEDTLARLHEPVLLDNPEVTLRDRARLNLVDPETFFTYLATAERPRAYTNSEDTLGRVTAAAAGTALGRRIRVAKDKALMRERLQPLYPDLFFTRVTPEELASTPASGLPYPLIVKPAVGFFSLGVVSARSPEEWDAARAQLTADLEAARGLFPESVLDATQLLVEQRVEGREFAIDTYFDAAGIPVLLNVMEHIFRDTEDTDDRVYLTSASIIREYGARFLDALTAMGRLLGFADLPAHVEFRVESSGRAVPIEINPLRLAGFCCTELAWHAYGLNTHEAVILEQRPAWERLLAGRDSVYSLVLCKPPFHLDRSRIRAVDWEGLAGVFSKPLEIRPMDFHAYPLLALAFIESPDMEEPTRLLNADFSPYLTLG